MDISHTVSQSASNDIDHNNDKGNVAIMDDSQLPSQEDSMETANSGNMDVGLKRVMPSFGMSTTMKDGNDDSENEDKDTNYNTANMMLTQHDPDKSETDHDSDAPAFEQSSSDDDDDEDEDDESDDDDGEEEEIKPALEATRAANIKRNNARMWDLGFKKISPKRDIRKVLMSPASEPPTPRPQQLQEQQVRGMVFATPYNNSTTAQSGPAQQLSLDDNHEEGEAEDAEAAMLEDLEGLYPHRTVQIHQLWSLLSPSLPPVGDPTGTSSSFQHTKSTTNIPPPIFVTGPTATGKTSIVRDVVKQLQQSRATPNILETVPHRVGSAYINCATLDKKTKGSPMDEILHEAYRQLARDMKAGRNVDSWRRRRKRRRKNKAKSPAAKSTAGAILDNEANAAENTNPTPEYANNKRQQVEDSGAQADAEDVNKSATNDQSNGGKGSLVMPSDGITTAEDKEKESDKPAKDDVSDDQSPIIRRSRRVSELTGTTDAHDKNEQRNNANATKKGNATTTAKKSAISTDLDATTNVAVKEGDLTAVATAASRTAHMAAASFGQEIKDTLFCHANDCGFLILDQAEQLLSVTSSTAAAVRTNFLSQLLLLPRTMGLNLTIIVITKSIVLEHSRFNNVVIPEKSLSTISSALQPLHIHFQSYKGKESLKQILSRPRLLERIVGPNMLSSYKLGVDKFSKQVVRAFLNTLVQTLYGSTRDLKEMVRLGRLLWPVYVKPLHSSNLEKTMKNVQKMMPSPQTSSLPTTESNGKQILSYLDQQMLPQIRSKVEYCLYSFTGQEEAPQQNAPPGTNATTTSQTHLSQTACQKENPQSMAYLSKCLVLAAFICQTNRPDKDRQLFTIQKNGKKNTGNRKKSHGEDLAFGSNRNGAPKGGYRPRMFPMERMLSVFVSIVGLNQGQMFKRADKRASGVGGGHGGITSGSIGSSDFFEALAHLRDIGVLHDKAGRCSSVTDSANLGAPKFWCSATRDEADGVAKSVQFPLDDYLL